MYYFHSWVMPKINLRNSIKKFERDVRDSYELVSVVNRIIDDKTSTVKHKHAISIYEVAFIRIFNSWERFLEDTFTLLISGSKIKTFRAKTFVKKITTGHALLMISGTKEYPDWTKIQDVIKLADIYFKDGEPFKTPLYEIEIYFRDIKKIRNAIVHSSKKANDDFINVIKSKIPSYKIDTKPGEFLSMNIPGKQGELFFSYYVSYLEAASRKILHLS